MRCILISGRTSKQGTSLELGKASEDYLANVAVVMMNEEDMREIGIAEGIPVKVRTRFGGTVVKCVKSRLDRGTIFMPFGPWTSLITGSDTQGTGMPDLKGIEAEVSATEENVQTISDILKIIRGTP